MPQVRILSLGPKREKPPCGAFPFFHDRIRMCNRNRRWRLHMTVRTLSYSFISFLHLPQAEKKCKRILSLGPRRRKLLIACGDFSCKAWKVTSRSFRCGSFPNRRIHGDPPIWFVGTRQVRYEHSDQKCSSSIRMDCFFIMMRRLECVIESPSGAFIDQCKHWSIL